MGCCCTKSEPLPSYENRENLLRKNGRDTSSKETLSSSTDENPISSTYQMSNHLHVAETKSEDSSEIYLSCKNTITYTDKLKEEINKPKNILIEKSNDITESIEETKKKDPSPSLSPRRSQPNISQLVIVTEQKPEKIEEVVNITVKKLNESKNKNDDETIINNDNTDSNDKGTSPNSVKSNASDEPPSSTSSSSSIRSGKLTKNQKRKLKGKKKSMKSMSG